MTARVWMCHVCQPKRCCRVMSPLVVRGSLIFVCIDALEWWLETGLVELDMNDARGCVVSRKEAA